MSYNLHDYLDDMVDFEDNGFLKQTAKDYDMTYDQVKRIYLANPKDFYQNLEQFIKERRNSKN